MSGQPSPTRVSLAACLREHPYFRDLPDARLAPLAAASQCRHFSAGEVLFVEGDPSAGMWVVESGRVKVYKLHLEGREHILHLCGPGDSFNDISAFDGQPNPASAAALSDAVVWVLPGEELDAAIARDPELARAVIDGMSRRVRGLVRQIEDLALYSVQARLARFLLHRATNPAFRGEGVTRAAIAAHLATTPESVSRTLRTLEEAGAIRFDRHRIVIADEELLRGLSLT